MRRGLHGVALPPEHLRETQLYGSEIHQLQRRALEGRFQPLPCFGVAAEPLKGFGS
jgi:hypothetical protein